MICGSSIEKDTAYKIIKGKINRYCCSEQEYKDHMAEQEEISKQKAKFYKMVEYFLGATVNTALYKEIQIWLSLSDYKTLCDYFTDCRFTLTKAMNKQFVSEYARIRYFSAIVKNSIGDYKPLKPEPVKAVEAEFYKTKYKPTKKRKCLSDYEGGE